MGISDLFTAAGSTQFLLAFTRVAALTMPLGLPGAQRIPVWVRLAWAAVITGSLWQRWLRPGPSAAFLPAGIAAELIFGTVLGLTALAAVEGLFFAMHLAGLQSGYQYASTIDPTTQADSPVLPVIGQLLGSLLFFALGGDRLLMGAIITSFEAWPPGVVPPAINLGAAVGQIGTAVLGIAVRIALPLVTLLVIIDLAIGVLSRAHAQLQLLSFSFPIKMLLALFTISALLPYWSTLFHERTQAMGRAALRMAGDH